ncbi:hypothetical protein [Kineococcus indalonis]|uniref:hypothetical protein n=1 Tax=Kineococcus indalonis TaxID=2696566 RepID=UPI001412E304|nr:hypothetical protein [Kineococcus indalonis]NAZ85565.1 hypothetical protein [Kineococcus indalonis]
MTAATSVLQRHRHRRHHHGPHGVPRHCAASRRVAAAAARADRLVARYAPLTGQLTGRQRG